MQFKRCIHPFGLPVWFSLYSPSPGFRDIFSIPPRFPQGGACPRSTFGAVPSFQERRLA